MSRSTPTGVLTHRLGTADLSDASCVLVLIMDFSLKPDGAVGRFHNEFGSYCRAVIGYAITVVVRKCRETH